MGMQDKMERGLAGTPLGLRLRTRRIAGTDRFRDQVERLAHELDEPTSRIARRAERDLHSMVGVESRWHTYLFDHALAPLHTQAWSVRADSCALDRLRELNREHALVFLPSHRSYADPFLMSQVVQDHGLQRNHILGGDNLNFWPLGPIARNSGGVFLRRSFRDDPVYKMVVREYLGYLVGRGENLEWYMEGGRSRSGKLRPPKYGLLAYLLSAIREGVVDDVILVPTSITYDQLHEVRAMASNELRGFKPKEGFTWLADYLRKQRQWIGNVHVRFGEPLSVAERLEHDDAQWTVEKIAFTVFQRINKATPVTTQALVTLALLAAADRALTLEEVATQVRPLVDYARSRSLPTSQVESLYEFRSLIEVLETLTDTGVISRYDHGLAPVFGIEQGQHAVAAFYRNSAVHWFINRAILELALWQVGQGAASDPRKEAIRATLALRDLLKFEFFFSDRHTFREELLDEAVLLDPDWQDHMTSEDQRLQSLRNAPFLISHTLLPSFFEAYFIAADRIAAHPDGRGVDRRQLVDDCVAVGQQYLLQRRLRHPECLSRELFQNAIRLADNRDLLRGGDAEQGERRRAFAEELSQAVAAVEAIADLDRRRQENVTDAAA